MHGLCPPKAGSVPQHTHTDTQNERRTQAERFYQENEINVLNVSNEMHILKDLWDIEESPPKSERKNCSLKVAVWQLKAEHVVRINTLPRVRLNSRVGGGQDLRLLCDDRHIRLIIVLLLTHITFTCAGQFPRCFLIYSDSVEKLDVVMFLKMLLLTIMVNLGNDKNTPDILNYFKFVRIEYYFYSKII